MPNDDEVNEVKDNDKVVMKRTLFKKLVIITFVAFVSAAFCAGFIVGGWNTSRSSATTDEGIKPFLQLLQGLGSRQQQQSNIIHANFSRSQDGSPINGRLDSPVTIVEFSDFQCQFCKRFFNLILPQIQKNYLDTGKVKLIYKEFPLDQNHLNARVASNAAECANEQKKFWQYHNILFSNQSQWQEQSADEAIITFKKYAKNIGLDEVVYDTCLDSRKYSNSIDNDLQQGSSYGVTGTPTFYIGNDKKGYTQVMGTQPVTIFNSIIARYLRE